ncbi:PAS domain S-box protein [Nonlabens mediterrranea]|uniref:histidine kinase n=1 Tax=Nonlabens mediterrranea TaxID=1419947 RepID=A0ABS0A5I9_9FLAO|nr:putative sensory transduction histidine kinase, PAS fold [Flavobacteria bacterium BBFL7]MBF4984663.1 PAS domain S-box protein [Nonlabens mediterrranea]
MSGSDVEILKRALERERAARKQAEKILEQKAAELYELTQKLRHSNEKLEVLIDEKTSELNGVFENIVDAYVVTDLYGNVLKMNNPAIDLLEADFTNESINLMDIVMPSEYENVLELFQKLLHNGSLTDVHVKIQTKNQHLKLVHINCSIIYDAQGKAKAAQGIVRDITKSDEDEKKLIESENRLSTLILNLENAVLLEDENGKIVLTNHKFCEYFEIPLKPEEIVGNDYHKISDNYKFLFDDPDYFIQRVDEILSLKKMVIGDELIMNNGRILERDFIPIIESDNYKGHLWSYRDVTLKRSYSKSLEAQKQKYSSIIANMHLGLVEVDTEEKIIMVNQSFTQMSGYTEEEVVGRKASSLFLDSDDVHIFKEQTRKRLRGESSSYEVVVNIKSNERRHWLISGAPNYDLEGNVTGSIGIHLDITDLKNLEIQKELLLAQLAKSNDELHEYAHIVSHDLKSPLRSIDALVNWLKADNLDKFDEISLKNLSLIEETLEKMEQLIGDILDYSSLNSSNEEFTEIDCNELVVDLIKVIYVPNHIEINLKGILPKINGDRTKVNQLFQNLLSNAVKFIDKEKGIIEVSCIELDNHYQFQIKDNGIGIDPAFHDKIFKIFHALNKNKDSTGIGLSIVKKIVDLHQGKIWLESKVGEGTTFFFTLKK